MPATYDLAAPAGQVRLLISDTNVTSPVFTDEEIAAFLGLELGVKRAAALALETIASNEALVLKVITTQDLQTDGAKLSAELRARAQQMRVDAAVADDFAADGGLVIIDTAYYTPELSDWPTGAYVHGFGYV